MHDYDIREALYLNGKIHASCMRGFDPKVWPIWSNSETVLIF